MFSETHGGWIMAVIATLLALWSYKLSKQDESTRKKTFENITFLGQKYACLHHEEPYFMLHLKTFIEMIQQGHFGILYQHQEPQIILLPIDEFYRLKAIEEHLEDQEIARIIEERIHTRDKNEPHFSEDFDALRAKIYEQKPSKGESS